MVFLDRESNNSPSFATNIGSLPTSLIVEGTLGDNVSFGSGQLQVEDTFDIYRFTVERSTNFGVTLVPQGTDANLVLMTSPEGRPIVRSSKPGTALDSVSVKNLLPGTYLIGVSSQSGIPRLPYSLSIGAAPITRAELGVTVERITAIDRLDSKIPFSSSHKADFKASITIDGQVRNSGVFDKDNDDVRPNFQFIQPIDPLRQSVNFKVAVKDADPFGDDDVDISPVSSSSIFSTQFFPASGMVGNVDLEVDGTGKSLITEGKDSSFRPRGARVTYRVDYTVFTSSSSLSNRTSTVLGNNASQRLQGQTANGILCGEGGQDDLFGMGGNDVLCGGTGNDMLNGGHGYDISFGGKGRDVHYGGVGRDTFVLLPDTGVDVIRDFQDGKDSLGLPIGLDSTLLAISQRGKDTVIGVGSQRLAVLTNVASDRITAEDFVTIDFTHFKGIMVPSLVG